VTFNPYAPPTAVVDDLAVPEAATEPPFFAVSVTKLLVMNLCTFSAYQVYWFYRNWKRIAEREPHAMWPVARAIFAIFYCYQCFSHIRDFVVGTDTGRIFAAGPLGLDEDTGPRLAAGPLAVGFIVTNLLWRLPDPYAWISTLAFVFLVPVQLHVNRLNAAANPLHDRNNRFSGWNWVAVVVGGVLVMLAVVGAFLPEVE